METEKNRRRKMDELKVLLPEIITEILARLPADSALECRCICKQWRSLIDHPSFVHTHTRQVISSSTYNPKKFGNYLIPNSCSSSSGLFLFAKLDKRNLRLEVIEYNDDSREEKSVLEFKPSKTIINQSFPFGCDIWGYLMISSCNGLVFMGSSRPNNTFVCNPFTKEYVNLGNSIPTPPGIMAYGFGYLPSTNEYKIVSIYYGHDSPKGQVSVYTLGSGIGWRNKGEIPYRLFKVHYRYYPGVFANGAIHWFTYEGKIVLFDLANEEFRVVFPLLPPVSEPAPNYVHVYGVLGGCLCVTRSDKTKCGSPKEIWILNHVLNTNNNNNNNNNKNEEVMDEFSWNKKFSIPWNGITSKAAPQVVSKSGKILLRDGTGLVSYDPKTEVVVEDDRNNFSYYRYVKVIPYTKSFVSVKAPGEEDANCYCYDYKTKTWVSRTES